MLVGQKILFSKIDKLLDSYPRFSVIVGPKNSGKRTIAKYICSKLGLQIIPFGLGIDEVRTTIASSYEQTKPICYLCADADGMSLGAKNSLLKITEEPPNNAYFIITLQSMSNTLETIQSRGTVLTLDPYSEQELIEYRASKNYNSKYDNIIKEICSSTGEVDELFTFDVDKFYKYAETVAFQIQVPTSGNIFKIPKQLKTSTTGDGFDPVLFFKTVRNLYVKKAVETKDKRYLLASNVTTDCLQDLALPTVNKLSTIDNWIFDVRKVLR